MPIPLTWAEIGTVSDNAIIVNADGSIVLDEKYIDDLALFAIDFARYAYKAQEEKNKAVPEESPLVNFAPPMFGTPVYDAENAKYNMAASATINRQMSLTLS